MRFIDNLLKLLSYFLFRFYFSCLTEFFLCKLICICYQEALYNIARACHHVGLVSLAATYYEKVLAIHEKDYPIPKLPSEKPDMEHLKPGYCDLRREAAYNLHLIYKKSGALDLARQVLKDHCSFWVCMLIKKSFVQIEFYSSLCAYKPVNKLNFLFSVEVEEGFDFMYWWLFL